MTDGDRIKTEARKALRLDLADRLAAVRAKLSADLTSERPNNASSRPSTSSSSRTSTRTHRTFA
ncbi:MAG TPA: hypothetical protein VHU80_10115 [Polyangiaceae bacterium]|jgi:hypothetical protein|nr:hypothetical protein [Polyangiaceae bacterium]